MSDIVFVTVLFPCYCAASAPCDPVFEPLQGWSARHILYISPHTRLCGDFSLICCSHECCFVSATEEQVRSNQFSMISLSGLRTRTVTLEKKFRNLQCVSPTFFILKSPPPGSKWIFHSVPKVLPFAHNLIELFFIAIAVTQQPCGDLLHCFITMGVEWRI